MVDRNEQIAKIASFLENEKRYEFEQNLIRNHRNWTGIYLIQKTDDEGAITHHVEDLSIGVPLYESFRDAFAELEENFGKEGYEGIQYILIYARKLIDSNKYGISVPGTIVDLYRSDLAAVEAKQAPILM